SPLKALTNDVQRTLGVLQPLRVDGSRALRIEARTGDTPARIRRLHKGEPADILLTTPESLAILLSQPSAYSRFASLRTVIVDEVHALADNKRGADLAVSLERLAEVTGHELQRIGLSATCVPLQEAARFLVGISRRCTIAHVADPSPLHIDI